MKKLTRLRQSAFAAQQGRCFYCLFPMWSNHPSDVFGRGDLSPKVMRHLQCTAEHLNPVSEGGKDEPDNILTDVQDLAPLFGLTLVSQHLPVGGRRSPVCELQWRLRLVDFFIGLQSPEIDR